MRDAARFELEKRVDLYQFYLGAYLKGIAFYLAITGALLKFAIDNDTYRNIFGYAGILVSLAVLVPLLFSMRHEKSFKNEFARLATATRTQAIETSPFLMLIRVVVAIWAVVFAGWLYITFKLQ